MFVCVFERERVCVCACVCMHMNVCMYVCIYAYMHAQCLYIHMRTHKYLQTNPPLPTPLPTPSSLPSLALYQKKKSSLLPQMSHTTTGPVTVQVRALVLDSAFGAVSVGGGTVGEGEGREKVGEGEGREKVGAQHADVLDLEAAEEIVRRSIHE